jgi:hypothetical protein
MATPTIQQGDDGLFSPRSFGMKAFGVYGSQRLC